MPTVPVGRFAPSPSGPLHFGSLVTALASYLDIRQRRGHWRLRIDDLDRQRQRPRAAQHIIQTLQGLGFNWDGPVYYQSQQHHHYQAALEELQQQSQLYPCGCSRKQIQQQQPARALDGGLIYPGACRHRPLTNLTTRDALRFNVQTLAPIHFQDRIQGPITQDLAQDFGDPILRRADGLIAYQLAVVIDDHQQGITDILRGADLLHSSSRQIALHHALGLRPPRYAHSPLILGPDGKKLSKQENADAISADQAPYWLAKAAQQLGMHNIHQDTLKTLPPDARWQRLIDAYNIQAIPTSQRT